MKQRKAGKLPKGNKAVFDQPKDVRAIARERVGTVKPARVLMTKTDRKKPKHKKPVQEQE